MGQNKNSFNYINIQPKKIIKKMSISPLGVSGTPSGQIILRMQYSERIPYGPTSLRLMISVVVISVSEVSVVMSKEIFGWFGGGRRVCKD